VKKKKKSKTLSPKKAEQKWLGVEHLPKNPEFKAQYCLPKKMKDLL
jgi:hypothetical protein